MWTLFCAKIKINIFGILTDKKTSKRKRRDKIISVSTFFFWLRNFCYFLCGNIIGYKNIVAIN